LLPLENLKFYKQDPDPDPDPHSVKMLDPDPDPHKTDAEPKHCYSLSNYPITMGSGLWIWILIGSGFNGVVDPCPQPFQGDVVF
jgi:hypothetical protein